MTISRWQDAWRKNSLTLEVYGYRAWSGTQNSKKTLKGIGVKEIYVGKLEDNAIHLTCFAKWKTSQVDKKKTEIEKQIPKMRVIQIQPMTRI